MNCNCGEVATFLTVKKEGPNFGKNFYCCKTKTCKFFQWTNDTKPQTNKFKTKKKEENISEGNLEIQVISKELIPQTTSIKDKTIPFWIQIKSKIENFFENFKILLRDLNFIFGFFKILFTF
jgi:hypothetical protein